MSAEKEPTGRSAGSKPSPDGGAAATPAPAPGLHLVATPIGNLGDITLRALDVLRGADVVYCEDTRVTGRLFQRYGIDTRLQSYHEHNAERVRPQIVKRLSAGEAVALVSDAGTPLVSDPGFKLVRACIDAEFPVHVLPGASAVLAALAVAGLPSDRFFFGGFLPTKSAARRRALGEVARIGATLVFFESGQRIGDSLADMAATLGGREAVIARELTKLHEEIRRGDLQALARHYAEAPPPRGEIVILLSPPGEQKVEGLDLDTELRRTLAAMSLRDAVAEVATITGLPRRQVYARALALAPTAGKLRGMP